MSIAKGEQTKTTFFVCEGKAVFPAKKESEAGVVDNLTELGKTVSSILK
ncbi:MAG TPA: hypothetical protein PKC21_02180 [Oligoflexia bacterium]|nr:hypothetical protein [Oligoflexia bacterium]